MQRREQIAIEEKLKEGEWPRLLYRLQIRRRCTPVYPMTLALVIYSRLTCRADARDGNGNEDRFFCLLVSLSCIHKNKNNNNEDVCLVGWLAGRLAGWLIHRSYCRIWGGYIIVLWNKSWCVDTAGCGFSLGDWCPFNFFLLPESDLWLAPLFVPANVTSQCFLLFYFYRLLILTFWFVIFYFRLIVTLWLFMTARISFFCIP